MSEKNQELMVGNLWSARMNRIEGIIENLQAERVAIGEALAKLSDENLPERVKRIEDEGDSQTRLRIANLEKRASELERRIVLGQDKPVEIPSDEPETTGLPESGATHILEVLEWRPTAAKVKTAGVVVWIPTTPNCVDGDTGILTDHGLELLASNIEEEIGRKREREQVSRGSYFKRVQGQLFGSDL